DRPDDEHEPLFQQPRVDVVGTFAAGRLLDDHRHEIQCLRFHSLHSSFVVPVEARHAGDLGVQVARMAGSYALTPGPYGFMYSLNPNLRLPDSPCSTSA